MSRQNSALLVVDAQAKLLALLAEQQQIIWNIGRLIDGAVTLDVPIVATEQYPQGLGPTSPEIAQKLSGVVSKLTFSCGGCPQLFEELASRGVYKILACGIETHVCIQQSVLDLMADGFDVYVAVDAVGARSKLDHKIAIRRMDSAGATLTTTEAALFEWCERAGTPEFKKVSAIVRQTPPA